ncbi:thymidine phosphorylase [candidate division WOR-3 bacterium]|nr:thymidine phosphorylase [candidate division WOR-3 bacterium]
MEFLELLRRKRDRGRLTPQEINWLINSFTGGSIPDYQMAAFLMAVYIQGMNVRETVAMTRAMMNSGRVLDLSTLSGPKVDKHSTGGVGDKVSLILAPLVAACGVIVPMVSGRSLGHTGGTLDKLEAIPGFKTNLGLDEFTQILKKIGVAIIGQTAEMCPADKEMYALRDVTATVESLPLITASIMAKKLAEGIDGLVLDVKTGQGAFMRRLRTARQLAQLMLAVGAKMEKKVVALITAMEQPLGNTVGNALEVREAIAALKNHWAPDLKELTFALAEEMLLLAGRAQTRPQARRQILRVLESGRALQKFQQMVEEQGGDPAVVEDERLLPVANYKRECLAEREGYIRVIDAYQVGMLGLDIGLGRRRLTDRVSPGAGFVFRKKVGDQVQKGEVLAEVFADTDISAERVAARLAKCFTYSERPVTTGRMILERLITPKESPKGRRGRHRHNCE